MVELFVGKKGKGKTKFLLDDVNQKIKIASGSIIFLDKNDQHIHDISPKVRLINVAEYPIETSDGFIGFISGIASQDYDIECIYIDGFLNVAHVDKNELKSLIEKLESIAEKRKISFVISLSMDQSELDESIKHLVKISL